MLEAEHVWSFPPNEVWAGETLCWGGWGGRGGGVATRGLSALFSPARPTWVCEFREVSVDGSGEAGL